MAPPGPGEIKQYRKNGSLKERMQFAEMLGNNRINPALLNTQSGFHNRGVSTEALPYGSGLPASGSPKIFTLLIEFPLLPHTQEQSLIEDKLFGEGDEDEYPYESLAKYYYRSSYGALDIQGTALPWYRARLPRIMYSDPLAIGVRQLIKEALRYHDRSHDFSQYDNNGDGVIDYFAVIWTGPDWGWGSIWWGWCNMDGSMFRNDPFTVDGKRLGVFSWQWETNEEKEDTDEFNPRTIIHETGHALGLPDYYDYEKDEGPEGGVGSYDMMGAGSSFDHNAFSKWLLDWISPEVYSGLPETKAFRPAAQQPDCLMLAPTADTADIFSEYFLVQNRSPVANDSTVPTSGLMIWHVNATLNADGTDFMYDNSYTGYKLLRMVQADGLGEIESGLRWAGPEDFFAPFDGRSFAPYAAATSDTYDGEPTGFIVRNITAADKEDQESLAWGTVLADIDMGDNSSIVTAEPVVDSLIPSQQTGAAPLDISFTCRARVREGLIAGYIWDFDGDGNEDDYTFVQQVTHTYNQTGSYTARVTVVDSDGAVSEPADVTITVE